MARLVVAAVTSLIVVVSAVPVMITGDVKPKLAVDVNKTINSYYDETGGADYNEWIHVDFAKKTFPPTTTTTTTTTTAASTIKQEYITAAPRPRPVYDPTNVTCLPEGAVCRANAVCFGDDDCYGGQCVGAFVGTCGCNACIESSSCFNDGQCGGLYGACDRVEFKCACARAFACLGYKGYTDRIDRFCNKKTCNAAPDSCHGLPCNSGYCTCPAVYL